MRALVTGGSGFLGHEVLFHLVSGGHEVTALARSRAAELTVEALGATSIPGDLDDPDSVDRAFATSGADVLVNLASLGFGHAPTIVAAAEEAGIRRAVFVSTTAIFTNLRASSKTIRTAAERSITASSLDWTILRPTMIYGAPGDRNMWRLLKLLRRTPVVALPGPGKLHQPVHVADLAQAVVSAAAHPEAIGKAYDVAGPCASTLRELVRDASTALNRRTRAIPVPANPIIFGLALLERLGKDMPISAEQVARLTEDKAFDISEARADLGYNPRSFCEGIAQEAALTR